MKTYYLLLTIFISSFSFNAAYAKQTCSTKEITEFKKQGKSIDEKADFYTCLLDNGIHTASIPYLIHLISISNSKNFQSKYLPKVLANLPREYEETLFKKLYKKKLLVSAETKSNLMYFFALRSFDKKRFITAQKYLKQQSGINFNRYAQSKFLKGVIYFSQNKLNSAEAQFERLTSEKFKLKNSELKKDIINASFLNLARIQIIKEDYSDAINTYRKVSFQDSQWFDGLIEMSWVMLSKQDYEGAIGNAEFINKSTNQYVYKPWIPIIQSVGLLKMCQFPEANSSVENFKTNYDSTEKGIKKYITKNLNKSWYSAAVKAMESRLTKSSVKKIPALVYYASRSSDVIAMQSRINSLLDEEDSLKKLKRKIKKDSKTYASFLIAKQLSRLPSKIENLEYKTGKLFKEKLNTTLKEHYDLQKIADIVDFEVFSRSSNSITLRVAGAKFKDKLKKTNRKQSSWKYVGEFWTDEVGKFRSFVKNKCVDDNIKVGKK